MTKVIQKLISAAYDSDSRSIHTTNAGVSFNKTNPAYPASPLKASSWKGRLISLIDLPLQIGKATASVVALPITHIVGALCLTALGISKLANMISKNSVKSDTMEKFQSFCAIPLMNWFILGSSVALTATNIVGLLIPELGAKARQHRIINFLA